MKRKKNVKRGSGILEASPHSCVFDTAYVFVVEDWFVPNIWRATSVSSVVMQRHSFFSDFGNVACISLAMCLLRIIQLDPSFNG